MRIRRPAPVMMFGVAALLTVSGCATRHVDSLVAPTPSTPWQPPPEGHLPAPAPEPTPEIPAEYLQPGATVSLEQVIDVALRNNPVTRTAWHQARAAAANLGTQKSAYLPDLRARRQHRPGEADVGRQPIRHPSDDLRSVAEPLLAPLRPRRAQGRRRRGAPRPLRRRLDAQRRHPGPRAAGGDRVLPVPEREGPGGRGRTDPEAGPGEPRGCGREAPRRGRHDRRRPPGEDPGLPGRARC